MRWLQSSVTLFGIVDLTARSVKNDTSQKRLDGSGLSSSRLGFRGIEDLGGGLKAGFWLEGALNPDDGNASGFNFQRRSTVSLMGGFGEIRLGRDKVPTQLNWDAFDPFDNTGMGANTRLSVASGIVPTGGTYGAFSRANNMISYITPSLVACSARPRWPRVKARWATSMGLRAGYSGGALLAAVGYGNTEVTGAIDAKETNFGASYDLKFMKLIGFTSKLDIGPASQDNWLVGATVPLRQPHAARQLFGDGRQGEHRRARRQDARAGRRLHAVQAHCAVRHLLEDLEHEHELHRGHGLDADARQ
ncbi:MAG: porin [Betaproteobacteria bacterium]|nr:porin [Betaproteobacteria bacterium]